jgi:hypothetical protein
MIDVSNIFDPSLTLPLLRGGNWIFLFPLFTSSLQGERGVKITGYLRTSYERINHEDTKKRKRV